MTSLSPNTAAKRSFTKYAKTDDASTGGSSKSNHTPVSSSSDGSNIVVATAPRTNQATSTTIQSAQGGHAESKDQPNQLAKVIIKPPKRPLQEMDDEDEWDATFAHLKTVSERRRDHRRQANAEIAALKGEVNALQVALRKQRKEAVDHASSMRYRTHNAELKATELEESTTAIRQAARTVIMQNCMTEASHGKAGKTLDDLRRALG
ncbi:hypothetical protein LTR37_000446 [Vermiconidia calcicola]|uniref:Uncharacterized protein n=1 Tax=Vermiconidia calcicola TaxID=1690605 RepID=A0ACC3NZ00_9PEZI|nr:hypothetical protein LTR37_000446 [Vermiconidia calcicola]